jgi:hydroxyacylglutathione hydrolase
VPLIVLSEKIGSLEVLTYLVACPASREALIVDPGGPAPTLAAQLDQKGWQVRWIVNTHGHADHVAGNDFWAARTGAPIIMHHRDWEFFRRPEMQAQAQAEGFPPLTRDTLFVEAAGRTDLPGGSLDQLIQSLQDKIMPLPDDTRIWPGHDYGGQASSTLGEEKLNNPYLTDFF